MAILFLFVWWTAAIKVVVSENPWYCHGIDCPTFEAVKNITADGQTVEIRKYPAQLFQTALDNGFERLFAYINGSNEDQEKVAMTSPVRSVVTEGRLRDHYVVSFYVPYKYQPPNAPPPKPSDSKVYLDSQPQITVGVVSFAGFENEREDEKEAKELSKVLTKEGIKHQEGGWVFAGYDPPFRLTGRHNEVWLKVEDM